jgi:hypothetical protein
LEPVVGCAACAIAQAEPPVRAGIFACGYTEPSGRGVARRFRATGVRALRCATTCGRDPFERRHRSDTGNGRVCPRRLQPAVTPRCALARRSLAGRCLDVRLRTNARVVSWDTPLWRIGVKRPTSELKPSDEVRETLLAVRDCEGGTTGRDPRPLAIAHWHARAISAWKLGAAKDRRLRWALWGLPGQPCTSGRVYSADCRLLGRTLAQFCTRAATSVGQDQLDPRSRPHRPAPLHPPRAVDPLHAWDVGRVAEPLTRVRRQPYCRRFFAQPTLRMLFR